MKKKLLIGTSIIFVIGLVLLILAVISGVKFISSSEEIKITGERYNIKSDVTLNIRGIFRIKEAKVTFKILDADKNLLTEKTLSTQNERCTLDTYYSINDFSGIPAHIEVEVDYIRFNNVFMIVLSSIIMIASAGFSIFVYKKDFR